VFHPTGETSPEGVNGVDPVIVATGETTMSEQTQEVYYDLHLTGLGYLNRAREISVKQGQPWLAVDIVALQGHADKLRKTRFDCKVAGREAQSLVRRLMPQLAVGKTVLVGFRLGDLVPETFVYPKGERQGETGITLKATLLKIVWVKVDGKTLAKQGQRADGVSA
jgi:hypothetical protein